MRCLPRLLCLLDCWTRYHNQYTARRLDELPAAGEEVLRRIYGDALVEGLLREHCAGVDRGDP